LFARGVRRAGHATPAPAVPAIKRQVEVGACRTRQPGVVRARGGVVVVAVGLNGRAAARQRASVFDAVAAGGATAAPATAAAFIEAGDEAHARIAAVAADHDVAGPFLRAGRRARLVVAGAVTTAVVGRRGGLRAEAHVEVGVARAAAHGDFEVAGAGGNVDGEVGFRVLSAGEAG